MKIARYAVDQKISYGLVGDGTVEEIAGGLGSIMKGELQLVGKQRPLGSVELLPPVQPSKIICLGLNYKKHARELDLVVPQEPIIFLKPPTAVIGHRQHIVYPSQSKRVDYEAELGVVIGRKCYQVDKESALEYVLGYTCANDVTARDLQPQDGQWTYAKGFDTFSPLGPWIKTGIGDPEKLRVCGYLNGKIVQDSFTNKHIFKVSYAVHYISHCMTLLPGDVIMMGTPLGVGPMIPGDCFRVVIHEIGELVNVVVNEGAIDSKTTRR